MEKRKYLTIREKALRVNLNEHIYGSFAEIGAGQDVAQSFFNAGAASGTMAKTISAYDMKFSDAIYGEEKGGRYVCESRLVKMIDKEYGLLEERLREFKPQTCFFSFSNTVTVLNFNKSNQGHGWIGLRFQLDPKLPPNDLIMHVILRDNHRHLQQETIGILGVNLIYACYYHHDDADDLLLSLQDHLDHDRFDIDMLRLTGPNFEHIDNRLLSLRLVKHGMSDATMFGPDGNVLQPSEELYKKNIFALRGRFRPITHVNMDMFEKGVKMFKADEDVYEDNVIVLAELTLNNLRGKSESKEIDEQDFLDRVDILASLGYTVLISSYQEYYRLVEYFSSFTRKRKVGILLGVYNLADVFKEKFYTHLKGGILEAFGKLFGQNVKLYIYPSQIPGSPEILNCANFQLQPRLAHLFQYLMHNNQLGDIKDYNPDTLHIYSDHVLSKIRSGSSDWEALVPDIVAKAIKERQLFGYPSPEKLEKLRELERQLKALKDAQDELQED